MKDEIKRVLFASNEKKHYDNYHQDVMDMYKMYVEMTDRISQRRANANQWFLTMNTALLTAIGFFITMKSSPVWIFAIICIAGALNCFLWFRLVLSYQQMNSGRFSVIHAIEEELPLKIYRAEWMALGEGKDSKIYKPFTHIEKFVPVILGVLYLLLGIAGLCLK